MSGLWERGRMVLAAEQWIEAIEERLEEEASLVRCLKALLGADWSPGHEGPMSKITHLVDYVAAGDCGPEDLAAHIDLEALEQAVEALKQAWID